MANGDRLQVILEARDEMTSEIRKAQKSVKALEAEQKQYADAAEKGNREAAQSYERVRQEILDQKDAVQRLKSEQKIAASEARKIADAQARDAFKAKMAIKEQAIASGKAAAQQRQDAARVAASIGRVADKIGLQGREWDKVADKAVKYKSAWIMALQKVGLKAKETNGDIAGAGGSGSSKKGGGLGAVGLFAGGAAAAVTAGIMGVTTAFYALSGAVEEARGARRAMAQTDAVMRSMGRTEDPVALTKTIDRLEELSGIDGDSIREMTNVLLTFGNVTGKTLTKANELALDLSVAFGKDLQSSAVMVGKALNDPVKGLTALSRIGVQFTGEQEKQIKAMTAANDIAGAQAIIMKELGKQVGGSAAAQADGLAKTQVAWGNLKEAVGEVVMSISTGMGGDAAGAINSFTKLIKDNKYQIVSVIQVISSALFKLISVYFKWQSILIKGLGYVAGAASTTLQMLAKMGIVSQETADRATALADGLGAASEQANNASTWFDNLSTKAKTASERTRSLHEALKLIDGKKARAEVEVTLKGVWDAVDSATAAAAEAGLPTRWMGGPTDPGRTIVGELGPEVWVPKIGAPQIIGADGPEIRNFSTSGFVIPNHLLHAAPTSTVTRERVVEQARGPLVENLVVRSEADAMRELQRMQAREARINSERRG